MLGLMSNKNLLISSLIEHSSEYHADTEIVHRVSNGNIEKTNYKETNIRIRRLASALTRMGIKLGDRLGTIAWSNLRHLELYYGISGIGAICHTINPRLFKEQLIFIINDAQNKILFVDLDFIELISEISNEIPTVETIILLCAEKELTKLHKIKQKVLAYESLIENNQTLDKWPDFDERTASSLCYTSGTTGNPKGVLYSHRSTMIHTLAAANPDALDISSTDVIMPIAPMFHANAWGIPYIANMVGAKLVLPGRHLDGESVYNILDKEEVTFTAAVPTIWLMLFEYLDKKNKKLKFLKRCVIGGSACPKFMIEDFHKKYGVEVIHAWGMTETSPLGTVNKPLRKHSSLSQEQKYNLAIKQGRPMYGVKIKITNDDGEALPHDGKAFGNLWVKGPWICSGYLNMTNSDVHDENEWFLTGDVASIDQDGYMLITDRVKDVIKSGGEWISSIQIENIAAGHKKVSEAAVIGVKHKKWDERPLLLIVKAENVKKDEILDFLKDKIAKWWMPDDIIFVEELPHTATGKIRKVELKKTYQNYFVNPHKESDEN
ncbi:MAG: 3-methylmercaptopropionyl-CoA ligase [Alphaproteobacteria bacterium MarineAlpha9_Bin4]|nr:long-chain fatty acid--CoA ligase [Pelagibacterales bacterium]PPR27150.1 MAG: 3-methylmercaptopropionyl-CoA ligase [Alphaproteobacteria bacterium MarineAlpha9_Bin4]